MIIMVISIIALIIIFIILFTAVWALFFKLDGKSCEKIAEACKNALDKGDSKRVRNLLKILSRQDKSIEVKYQLGVSQLALEEYKKAKESFLAILKVNKEHAKAMTKLAEIECAEKNYNKALEYYLKSIQIDARDVENFKGIADIYFLNREYPKALEIYQKAKELEPEDNDINLAILKCKSELCGQNNDINFETLINEYLELEQTAKNKNFIYREVANIYAKSGNVEKAQEYCSKILEENPSDIESLRMIGLLMLLKQDLDSAKEYLTKAFSVDPKNIETHNILSYVVSQQVNNTPISLCRMEYYNLISKYLKEEEQENAT